MRRCLWRLLSIGLFMITGIVSLSFVGVGLEQFRVWISGAAGWTARLATKLILVAAIVTVSGFYDFFVGPRASRAMLTNLVSPETVRLRRQAIRLVNLLSWLSL
jgi:hypothetical protein